MNLTMKHSFDILGFQADENVVCCLLDFDAVQSQARGQRACSVKPAIHYYLRLL
jgi:hypothetical protein